MRVVALVSGGKDSCYSMQLCKQHGHDIVALANLLPEESASDELDSFCFQTVGHQLIGAYASCMGLPLFRKRISGTSSVQDLGYSPTEGDEVEDLYHLLAYVKENVPGIQAVASGAIASDYQRLRVENVCSRLNLVSLAYLWHQPQRLLLRGMVESGVEAILVKVACLGLHPRMHLGRTITAMEPTLLSLADAYGCNVCGEGGEYETLTLDCPVFTRGRIELDESEIVHGTSDVAHLVPKAFRVVAKPGWEGCELPSDVRLVPGDYVAAPRASRCSASQLPSLAAASATATAPGGGGAAGGNSIAAAVGSGGSTAAAACGVDSLLQPVAPSSFHVHVSMCSGPDYVQLLCRAVRPRSVLPSDLTECDTTAALHALLATAEQELASQNMDLHHCLFVHLFLANMGHFQAANGVYCKHFPSRDPPSRACVQVCLPHDCPVMCEFLLARGAAPPAVAPRSSLSAACPPPPPSPVTRHARRVLHVQSISSWAPSCIGPYSQATSYRGLVYLAGVIPLDPPVMTLVPGDITAQVLRAMMSCEAVAVAQRTTVVGAALGLTVYLAAAVGGGGAVSSNLTPGSLGGGGGGTALERSGMSFSSSGGAELRALTRSAVEAILEHGLPGYAHSPYRQNNAGPPSAGSGGCSSSGRYHRSSTCESGIATPRSSHGTWPGAAGQGRVSAPPSRRSMLLGADGLDEEEEEAERVAAAAVTSGGPAAGFFGGRVTSGGQLFAAAPVLDPYLQPPEVRVSIRPSVLYVTVPSLPRGSLVEIQPVCLDVEALSVIRKLTGHDSFVKRRNNSQHDALHQSAHNQQHGNNNNQNNHHSTAAAGVPLAQPSAANAHGLVTAVGVIHSSPTAGGGTAIGSITSWSELPPTPRASLESLTGRDGGGGGGGGGGSSHNHSLHHPPSSGSSPMHWQVSADLLAMGQLASPLPSHMLSATGFLSPEAGCSLAGTPSGVPFALSRQRSSAVGLLAMSGSGNVGAGACGGYMPAGFSLRAGSSSNLYQRCLSPSPQPLPTASSPQVPGMQAGLLPPAPPAAAAAGGPLQLPMLQTPPHPPLSTQNSSHQLLSPTLQHLLQMQPSPPLLLQPLQQATMDAPPLQQFQQLQIQQQQRQSLARPTPMGAVSRRRRVSSSNGGAAASRDALEAAATAGMAGRASYSGSSSSNSGPLGHHRSSLDGNILSFEVSSGRGGPPVVVSPLPHSVPHSVNAASLVDVPATLPATVAGAVASDGNGNATTVRARPAAITVPQSSVGGSLIQRSPFETAVGTAAGAVAAAAGGMALSAPGITTDVAAAMLAAGGASPRLCAATASGMAGPCPPPSHFPPALTIPPQSSGGSGSDSTPTPGQHATVAGRGTPPVSEMPTAPSGAGTRLGPAPASGSSSNKNSSSDVMVTTVCCYGQVLRSLFHLPPAVFAPGVTTAQLTRRFRRAAASVLAAHGMDMSCLIWVRLWYQKGSVEFMDDEYGTVNSSMPHASTLATVAAGSGAHHGAVAAAAAAAAIPVGGISSGFGPRVLHALENDADDDTGGGGSGGSGGGGSSWHRGKSLRSASSNSDSNSGGGGATNQNGATAHGLGCSTVSCASQRPSASPRLASAAEAVEVPNGPASSPRCHSGSPAAGVVSSSAHNRRVSSVQPDILALDDRQSQQSHQHQHHHQHHQHSQHHHHTHGLSHHQQHHQQQGPKDGPTNELGQGQGQPAPLPPLQQHFHVSWVPVQRVATNASPQLAQCVAVLELLAALPAP
ncbi:hypothetical protein VaNZ11_003310 [Volvox africanus]|uniref:Diphthine--ammonia ligase n=1 Tax=Volvox africanus TaxID=51714 RepID=A0ABQ5RTW4_9CHLO|nr:hypothetical protein VaNZ11_003310 [Volvox africanus]